MRTIETLFISDSTVNLKSQFEENCCHFIITFNEVAILIEEQCGGVNTELVARFKLSNKQEQQPDRRRCSRSQVSSSTEDSADTIWSLKFQDDITKRYDDT